MSHSYQRIDEIVDPNVSLQFVPFSEHTAYWNLCHKFSPSPKLGAQPNTKRPEFPEYFSAGKKKMAGSPHFSPRHSSNASNPSSLTWSISWVPYGTPPGLPEQQILLRESSEMQIPEVLGRHEVGRPNRGDATSAYCRAACRTATVLQESSVQDGD